MFFVAVLSHTHIRLPVFSTPLGLRFLGLERQAAHDAFALPLFDYINPLPLLITITCKCVPTCTNASKEEKKSDTEIKKNGVFRYILAASFYTSRCYSRIPSLVKVKTTSSLQAVFLFPYFVLFFTAVFLFV